MTEENIIDTGADVAVDTATDASLGAENIAAHEDAASADKDAPITEGASDMPKDLPLAELARADLEVLKHEFAELAALESIAELENAVRYGALRDLGLTPREAYLASAPRRAARDNRAHLQSAVPIMAATPEVGITAKELSSARELFSGLSDREIRSLYKRVTR